MISMDIVAQEDLSGSQQLSGFQDQDQEGKYPSDLL
jgi:hypothetical protein